MPLSDKPDNGPTLSLQTHGHIHQLVTALLERCQVHEPPVPIERMLTDPLLDLWKADPRQTSSSFGHGLYRYSSRMAQARLLYRTLSESAAARQAGLNAPWPATRRETKYFARCLLMPEDWIRALPDPDRTSDAIGEKFQVPSFDAIIRLAELGLPVPDGESINLDQF